MNTLSDFYLKHVTTILLKNIFEFLFSKICLCGVNISKNCSIIVSCFHKYLKISPDRSDHCSNGFMTPFPLLPSSSWPPSFLLQSSSFLPSLRLPVVPSLVPLWINLSLLGLKFSINLGLPAKHKCSQKLKYECLF